MHDMVPTPAEIEEVRRLFKASGKRFFCFVSYTTREHESRGIRKLVGQVCERLDALGLKTLESPVFHDGIFDIGGSSLISNMMRALEDSVFVSAYISPEYFLSDYCMLECEYGLNTSHIHWLMWKLVANDNGSGLLQHCGKDITNKTLSVAASVSVAETLRFGLELLSRK